MDVIYKLSYLQSLITIIWISDDKIMLDLMSTQPALLTWTKGTKKERRDTLDVGVSQPSESV